jgi:hypothetical protein
MHTRSSELRTSLSILALTALAVAGSAFIAFSLIPPLIADAYRGESIGLLNWAIEGQSVHPVEFYLAHWNAVARGALVVVAGLGILLAVACWPPLQRRVDARIGAVPPGPDTRARWRMSPARVGLATALIAVLAGGQILDIALQEEHWPFTRYSMYATVQTERIQWIQVYGVTPEGEMFLEPTSYLHPFDLTRLPQAFEDVVLSGPDEEGRVRQALENLYELYAAGRRTGAHDGPPLTALRLYRVQWKIDPDPETHNQPEQRILLYELPVS